MENRGRRQSRKLAYRKLMNSQKINLRKWVIYLEDLREVVNDLVTIIQCEESLSLQASCGVYPDRKFFAIILSTSARNVMEVSETASSEAKLNSSSAEDCF